MKTASTLIAVGFLLFVGCTDAVKNDHGHEHEASGSEPLACTIYSDKTELYVEFKPLVVGSKSNFAAHFTILGEKFLPLSKGKVTVSLIVGENGIRSIADSPSSPGIFRLALVPKTSGKGKLVFDIEAENYTDQIVIDNITVYADEHEALKKQTKKSTSDEIVYLKEQAWNIEFANTPVVKTTFSDIIKTSGEILSAPGDEMVISASANGIVHFTGNHTVIGSEISKNMSLFIISGDHLAENNLDTKYIEAKANYIKTKADFERAKKLVKDKIVSEAEFLKSKKDFENAKAIFNTVSKNYSSKGQNIISPINGYIKDVLVTEGQYVEAGTPLALVSENKKLLLQANLSQKYFEKLATISSAKFKPVGSDQVFDTEMLNGNIITYGKSTSKNSAFIPITFQIENPGNIIPGSVAEIFLKSSPIPNALLIPVSALMEEQGNFYVYVQLGGESFQKRSIKIGASDGNKVQVLSGLEEGERVVTKGAYQIKLSSASGELPAHGHEH